MAMAGTPHDAITLYQTTKHILIVSFTDMAVMCVRIYNEFESTSIPLSIPRLTLMRLAQSTQIGDFLRRTLKCTS